MSCHQRLAAEPRKGLRRVTREAAVLGALELSPSAARAALATMLPALEAGAPWRETSNRIGGGVSLTALLGSPIVILNFMEFLKERS